MFGKMIKKFKTEVHKVESVLDGKPKLYETIGTLKIALEYEMDVRRVSPELLQSVGQLYALLRDAMQKFDDNTPPKKSCTRIGYILIVQQFAEECHSAIFSYQPSLMSAPDLWSQIKAYVNNFLDQFFGLDPFFNTNKSELCIKSGDFSNKFFAAKNAVKPTIDDETNSSCCIFN